MNNLKFSQDESADSDSCGSVVVIAWNEEKLVLIRKAGQPTWELPNSELLEDESTTDAAERIMYEYTGAEEFQLYPVDYFSYSEGKITKEGMLFTAEILDYDDLPSQSEVEEILLFDELPEESELSFPFLHPELYKHVLDYLKNSINNL